MNFCLEVKDLVRHFPETRRIIWRRVTGIIKAVDGVSFQVNSGQTLGLAGESGSGKTTVAKCILGLYPPTSGEVWFEGVNLSTLSGRMLWEKRRNIGFVFQDPYSSLDPRMTCGEIIAEPLFIHNAVANKKEAWEKVKEMLRLYDSAGKSGAADLHSTY